MYSDVITRDLAIRLCIQMIQCNANVSQVVINNSKLMEWWNNIPQDIQRRLLSDETLLYSALGYNNFCLDIIERL